MFKAPVVTMLCLTVRLIPKYRRPQWKAWNVGSVSFSTLRTHQNPKSKSALTLSIARIANTSYPTPSPAHFAEIARDESVKLAGLTNLSGRGIEMTTKIEWTDETWSPVTGCSPISDGCKNCYAKRMSKRLAGRYGYPKDDPFKVTPHYSRMSKPFGWKKSRRIFVCSMGDIFHKDVKPEWRQDVWDVMHENQQHTYIILTKRPKGAAKYKKSWWFPNIWLGVTAENQQTADERIPILLQTPAAVRFVSVEPMLSKINIRKWLPEILGGIPFRLDSDVLQWIICGAETGPGARHMQLDWAIDLKNQCKEAGIPFFFKKASKGDTVPPELLIREFPKT
jgi:protein gp37